MPLIDRIMPLINRNGDGGICTNRFLGGTPASPDPTLYLERRRAGRQADKNMVGLGSGGAEALTSGVRGCAPQNTIMAI